jgi:DNA-binding beta-propeller fold protein YncE
LRRNRGVIEQARFASVQGAPFGMTLTHDEKLLIVAAGTQLAFLDVKKLISGEGNPVLGYFRDRTFAGAIMVTVTSDDRYLFVSQENGSAISVIDLAKAQASGFDNAVMIGSIPTALAPVSVVFSPDERYLYATSQEAHSSFRWPIECRPQVNRSDPPDHPHGVILVIDVARAKTTPASSVVGLAPGGCNPVRLALSPDGRTAYVTARTDDLLLAFDTGRILSDPKASLIGRVPVGTAPVGVAVADRGRKLVVANSNRFAGAPDGNQSLTVIDADKIASGAAAVLGTIPAGAFPRQLHVSADGKTVLLTNFASGTLQIVDLDRALPAQGR